MFSLTRQCYLCLSSKQSLAKATQSDSDGIPLLEKLKYCSIDLVLVIPASRVEICKYCYTILKVSYEFKRRCVENNKKLTNYEKLLSKDSGIYSDLLVMLDDKAFYEHSQELKQKFKNNAVNSKENLKRKKENKNDDSSNTSLAKPSERTENATLQNDQIKQENCLPQQQLFVKLERLNDQFMDDYMERAERNREETVIKVEDLDEFLPNLNQNDVLFIDYPSQPQDSTEIIDIASINSSNFDEISNNSNYQEYLDNIKDSPIDFNDDTVFDYEDRLNYEKLLDSLRRNKIDLNNEAVKEHATILIDDIKEEEEEITIDESSDDQTVHEDASKSNSNLERTTVASTYNENACDNLEENTTVSSNNEAENKKAPILHEDQQKSTLLSSNNEDKNKNDLKNTTLSSKKETKKEKSSNLRRNKKTSKVLSSDNEDKNKKDLIAQDISKSTKIVSESNKVNNEEGRNKNVSSEEIQKSMPESSYIKVRNENDLIIRDTLKDTCVVSSNNEAIIEDSSILTVIQNSMSVSSLNEGNDDSLRKSLVSPNNNVDNEEILKDSLTVPAISSNSEAHNEDSTNFKAVSINTEAISEETSNLSDSLQTSRAVSSNHEAINKDALIISASSASVASKIIKEDASILCASVKKPKVISSNNEAISKDAQISSEEKASKPKVNSEGPRRSAGRPSKTKATGEDPSILSKTSRRSRGVSSKTKSDSKDVSISIDNLEKFIAISSNSEADSEVEKIFSPRSRISRSKSSQNRSISKSASISCDNLERFTALSSNSEAESEVEKNLSQRTSRSKSSQNRSISKSASVSTGRSRAVSSNNKAISEVDSILSQRSRRSRSKYSKNKSITKDASISSDNKEKSITVSSNNEANSKEISILSQASRRSTAISSKTKAISKDAPISSTSLDKCIASSNNDANREDASISSQRKSAAISSKSKDISEDNSVLSHHSRRSRSRSAKTKYASKDSSISCDRLEKSIVVSSNNEASSENVSILSQRKSTAISLKTKDITEDSSIKRPRRSRSKSSKSLSKESSISSDSLSSSINSETSEDASILSQRSRRSRSTSSKIKTISKEASISSENSEKSKNVPVNNKTSKDVSILIQASRRSRSSNSKIKSISKDPSVSSDKLERSLAVSSNNEARSKDVSILIQASRESRPSTSKIKAITKYASVSSDKLGKSLAVSSNNEASSDNTTTLSPRSRGSTAISSKSKAITKNASISSDNLEKSIAESSNNEATSADASILRPASRGSRLTSSKIKAISKDASISSDNLEKSMAVSSNNEASSENASILRSTAASSKTKTISNDASISNANLEKSMAIPLKNEASSDVASILSDNSKRSTTVSLNNETISEDILQTSEAVSSNNKIINDDVPVSSDSLQGSTLLSSKEESLNEDSSDSSRRSTVNNEASSEDASTTSDSLEKSKAVSSNKEAICPEASILNDGLQTCKDVSSLLPESSSIVHNLQKTAASRNESLNEIAAILCSLQKSVPGSANDEDINKNSSEISSNLKRTTLLSSNKDTLKEKFSILSDNKKSSAVCSKDKAINKDASILSDSPVDLSSNIQKSKDACSSNKAINEDISNNEAIDVKASSTAHESSNNDTINEAVSMTICPNNTAVNENASTSLEKLEKPPNSSSDNKELNETSSIADILDKSTTETSNEALFNSPLFEYLEIASTPQKETMNKNEDNKQVEDANSKNDISEVKSNLPENKTEDGNEETSPSSVDFEDLIYPIELPRDVNLLRKKLIGPEGLIIEQINFQCKQNDIKFVTTYLPIDEKEREQKKLLIEQFLCKQEQSVITSQGFETKTKPSNIIYKEMSPLLIKLYDDILLTPDEKTDKFIQNCVDNKILLNLENDINTDSDESNRNSVIEIHFVLKDIVMTESHLEEHSYSEKTEETSPNLQKKRKLDKNTKDKSHKIPKLTIEDDTANVRNNQKASNSGPDLRSTPYEEPKQKLTKRTLRVTGIQSTENIGNQSQPIYSFEQLPSKTKTTELETQSSDIEQKQINLEPSNEPTCGSKYYNLKVKTYECENKPRMTQVIVKLIKPLNLTLPDGSKESIKNQARLNKSKTRKTKKEKQRSPKRKTLFSRRKSLLSPRKESSNETSTNPETTNPENESEKPQEAQVPPKSRLLTLIDQLSNVLTTQPTTNLQMSPKKKLQSKNKRKRTRPKSIHQLKSSITQPMTLTSTDQSISDLLNESTPLTNPVRITQPMILHSPDPSSTNTIQESSQPEITPPEMSHFIKEVPIAAGSKVLSTKLKSINKRKRTRPLHKSKSITLFSINQPINDKSNQLTPTVNQITQSFSSNESTSATKQVPQKNRRKSINILRRTKSQYTNQSMILSSTDQKINDVISASNEASNQLQTSPMVLDSIQQPENAVTNNKITTEFPQKPEKSTTKRKRTKSLHSTSPLTLSSTDKPLQTSPVMSSSITQPPSTFATNELKTNPSNQQIEEKRPSKKLKRSKSLHSIEPITLEQPSSSTTSNLLTTKSTKDLQTSQINEEKSGNKRRRTKSMSRTPTIRLKLPPDDDSTNDIPYQSTEASNQLLTSLMTFDSIEKPRKEKKSSHKRKRSKSSGRTPSIPFYINMPTQSSEASNKLQTSQMMLEQSKKESTNRKKLTKSLQNTQSSSLPFEDESINEISNRLSQTITQLQTSPMMLELKSRKEHISTSRKKRSKSVPRAQLITSPFADESINDIPNQSTQPSTQLQTSQMMLDFEEQSKKKQKSTYRNKRSKSVPRTQLSTSSFENESINDIPQLLTSSMMLDFKEQPRKEPEATYRYKRSKSISVPFEDESTNDEPNQSSHTSTQLQASPLTLDIKEQPKKEPEATYRYKRSKSISVLFEDESTNDEPNLSSQTTQLQTSPLMLDLIEQPRKEQKTYRNKRSKSLPRLLPFEEDIINDLPNQPGQTSINLQTPPIMSDSTEQPSPKKNTSIRKRSKSLQRLIALSSDESLNDVSNQPSQSSHQLRSSSMIFDYKEQLITAGISVLPSSTMHLQLPQSKEKMSAHRKTRSTSQSTYQSSVISSQDQSSSSPSIPTQLSIQKQLTPPKMYTTRVLRSASNSTYDVSTSNLTSQQKIQLQSGKSYVLLNSLNQSPSSSSKQSNKETTPMKVTQSNVLNMLDSVNVPSGVSIEPILQPGTSQSNKSTSLISIDSSKQTKHPTLHSLIKPSDVTISKKSLKKTNQHQTRLHPIAQVESDIETSDLETQLEECSLEKLDITPALHQKVDKLSPIFTKKQKRNKEAANLDSNIPVRCTSTPPKIINISTISNITTLSSGSQQISTHTDLFKLISPEKIKPEETLLQNINNIVVPDLQQPTSTITKTTKTLEEKDISNLTIDPQIKENTTKTTEQGIKTKQTTKMIKQVNIPMKRVLLKLAPRDPNSKKLTKIVSIEPHKLTENDSKTTEKTSPKINDNIKPISSEPKIENIQKPIPTKKEKLIIMTTCDLPTKPQVKPNKNTVIEIETNKSKTEKLIPPKISDSITIIVRPNPREKTSENKTIDTGTTECKTEKSITPKISNVTTDESNENIPIPKIKILSNELISPEKNKTQTIEPNTALTSSENNIAKTTESKTAGNITPQSSDSVITNPFTFKSPKTPKIKILGNQLISPPCRSDGIKPVETKTALKKFEDELIDYAKNVWKTNPVELKKPGSKPIEKKRTIIITKTESITPKPSDNKTDTKTAETLTSIIFNSNADKTNDIQTPECRKENLKSPTACDSTTIESETTIKPVKTIEKEIMEFETFLFGTTDKKVIEKICENSTKTQETITTTQDTNSSSSTQKTNTIPETNATPEVIFEVDPGIEVDPREILLKTKAFKCYKCNDQFRNRLGIEEHLAKNKCFFICDQCSTGFLCYNELKLHRKSHKLQYYCKDLRCKEQFDDVGSMFKHYNAVHKSTDKR